MSRFFIDRPIFAWVLAIVVMLSGVLAINTLPIAQYPSIAPPAISVSASYPGASARTLEDTVTKEIHEETGYKNVGEIIQTDFVSHGLFFHPVKNVNRLAHYHLVITQLKDLERDEVSDEEKAIADFVWVDKRDVMETLTRSSMKYLWECYLKL